MITPFTPLGETERSWEGRRTLGGLGITFGVVFIAASLLIGGRGWVFIILGIGHLLFGLVWLVWAKQTDEGNDILRWITGFFLFVCWAVTVVCMLFGVSPLTT